MKIGNVEIDGRCLLAPMAGVTDYAFRRICRENGAALTTTEMISARALTYGDKKTKILLYIPKDEHPSAIQIFGHEPEIMAEAAQIALELSSADILDINMGCPVGKIVRAGDGSALMQNLPLAEAILKAVCSSVSVPVTVKFRKGFDGGHVNAPEFARMAEAAGVSAVTVHGRTRTQMYAGRADWDIIREVKQSVRIPVSANGDVFSGEDAAHILRYTGADFVMIGRGSFGNPWIFQQANAHIDGTEPLTEPDLAEKMDTAVRQIELLAEQRGEHAACLEARHQMSWYLHGVAHASYYRQRITQISTLEDVKKIAAGVKQDLL